MEDQPKYTAGPPHNDCPKKDECRDVDDKYCCKEYREKAQGHCFLKALR
jgi:hypothetical protein